MPSTHTDPDSLRRVAVAITQAEKEIDAAVSRMKSTLASAQWNDSVRAKFENEFNALLTQLNAFKRQAPQTVNYLKQKAAKLDEYLRT